MEERSVNEASSEYLLADFVQAEQDKLYAAQLAYETQLADPELVFRSISFANLVSTWLIRQVDPRKKHPNPLIESVIPSLRQRQH